MVQHSPIGFEDEARELAENDHYILSRQLEVMQSDCSYTWQDIVWWKRDEIWRDDVADFFDANRAHYLERAREEFAESYAPAIGGVL